MQVVTMQGQQYGVVDPAPCGVEIAQKFIVRPKFVKIFIKSTNIVLISSYFGCTV